MTQPNLFSASAATISPLAIQARRSGRRAVAIAPAMLAYRDALLEHGPATDPEIAQRLGWGVSSCCGRRGDWNLYRPGSVVPVERVKVGKATQCRWRFMEQGTLAEARS